MAFDTLQKSRYILKILTTICILTNKKLGHKLPKCQPIYYKLLLHVPATFTFTLFMWLEVSSSADLTQATDVLYMALTETALVVKILSVWYYEALLKSLFDEWHENEMFQLQKTQECAVWQRRIKVYGYLVFFYTVSSLGVVTSAFAAVLFHKGYQLPYSIWLPFNWKHPSNYWYAYFYELFVMPLTCISNTTLDMLFCYMLQHLTLHFKVIAMRLESLGTSKKKETSADVARKLVAIIELHMKLKRMSKSCETIVTYPILSQISLSALILCFSLYCLQSANVLEDPLKCFSLVMYLVVMNLQIFVFCFYGNKLTLESADLIKSLYSCNWPEMSRQNRKIVFQYMQSLQKPVVIKAGNFFNVDLVTYTKTMNNAYSFFALLMNMDIE